MRLDGTLAKWNEDRGFGFITPAQGGQEIFVHISAFPKDGRRPRLNERLSFEIELNGEGKKRAAHVLRPVVARPIHTRRTQPARSRESRGPLGRIVMVAVLGAVAAYGYTEYARWSVPLAPATAADAPAAVTALQEQAPAPAFRCDGRIHCSQMTSCTEATYFLENCPGTKMDGDDDGIPCERQWCQ